MSNNQIPEEIIKIDNKFNSLSKEKKENILTLLIDWSLNELKKLDNQTMKTKQTAMQWLEDNLNFEPYDEEEFISNNKIWEQAKQMEKEQITKAYNSAIPFKFGEEYYNETYKQQDNVHLSAHTD
jgi:hypothetical protein